MKSTVAALSVALLLTSGTARAYDTDGLNTPQTSYRVTAGSHQITLFNPQFNIKETIKVTVAPGEIQTITKIFQQQ